MWMSKQVIKNNTGNHCIIGEVSESSGENISVLEDLEHKNIKSVVPYGVFYKMPVSEECVMLTDNGVSLCTGTIMKDKNLNDGELYISVSNNAGILLKKNGDIEINGRVKINGVIQ